MGKLHDCSQQHVPRYPRPGASTATHKYDLELQARHGAGQAKPVALVLVLHWIDHGGFRSGNVPFLGCGPSAVNKTASSAAPVPQ